jgi:hypothetical protein
MLNPPCYGQVGFAQYREASRKMIEVLSIQAAAAADSVPSDGS